MAVQPAYRDAERTNDSPRSARIYKDLNLNFGRHPVTKQINVLTDAAAVKRSVRNLVQYGYYEKPFHPEIGSGVRDMLFENMTPLTAQVLSQKILELMFVMVHTVMDYKIQYGVQQFSLGQAVQGRYSKKHIQV